MIFWLLGRTGSREQSAAIPKLPKVEIGSGPPVVIVTVIDPKADAVWAKRIKQNRNEYAKRHGLCHLEVHLTRILELTGAKAT
jgi:mannan polymerase II complex MNN11 subunit